MSLPPPRDDREVPGFWDSLGIPGAYDLHVHFMPMPVQEAVWRVFDRLEPAWPITYRTGVEERLGTLARLGVVAHTALAYPHRTGMAAWLNAFSLELAARHEAVVPTFTMYPEEGVDAYVEDALAAGGEVVKVHLQVGKFAATDPRLDGPWSRIEAAGLPVVLHAGAVADSSGGEEWCGAGPVARLLERFPGLVLVVAHAGAPDFADFLALAEAHPRVHLDTAMVLTDPPYLGAYPPRLLPRLERLADRVVFGSDFPSIPHEYAAQVRGLARTFGPEWLRRVCWDNPRRLLRRT